MEVIVVMAGCWSKLSLVETNCCSRPREKMTPTPHYQEKSAQLYVFLISWFARLGWVWVAEAADPGGGIKWSRCPVNLSSFQSWECPISCSGSAPAGPRTPSIPLHPPISYMVLKINLGDCPLSLVNTFYPFRGPWSNTLQRPGLDYYLFIYWLDYLLLLLTHTHWSWDAGHCAGQKTRSDQR